MWHRVAPLCHGKTLVKGSGRCTESTSSSTCCTYMQYIHTYARRHRDIQTGRTCVQAYMHAYMHT